MNHDVFKKRMGVIIGIIVFVMVVFAIKLFYLQIIHGHAYQKMADRQYVTPTSGLFDRGTVYFTDKEGNHVSAATLKSGFKIAVNPETVGAAEDLWKKIGVLIGADHDTFIAQVSKKSDPYEEIATQVPDDIASQVTAMKIPGVSVYRMNWRFYPAGDLAAQTIGFMGYKGDTFAGRYGIERSYDATLARTDQRLYMNFFAEVFSDMRKFLQNNPDDEGDVVTTLEPSVQKNLEEVLHGVIDTWHSDRAGGIIMDPKTGAIYAMALDNGFDLNQSRKVTDVSQFNNPLVENVFEMGSIVKPVNMAIAIDQGAVTPDTTYFDQGFVKVGDRTIYNFDKKGRGLSTMQTVLNQSLNTGMVFVMQHMNKSAFKTQWESFGFGQKTGIDLPAEGSGLISNLDTNRDVEYANASFGQGIAMTPVEMIRAFSVLANGGHLVTPHVGDAVEYPSGLIQKIDWPVGTESLIKPETAKTITDMLVTVFDNYAQGKIKLDHYTIAAKTGTAQIANHATGGYYTDRNLHTFAAYFPAHNPKFIVFLFNEYPKGAKFSSQTLLPPFVDMAKFLINYYDVPPDR